MAADPEARVGDAQGRRVGGNAAHEAVALGRARRVAGMGDEIGFDRLALGRGQRRRLAEMIAKIAHDRLPGAHGQHLRGVGHMAGAAFLDHGRVLDRRHGSPAFREGRASSRQRDEGDKDQKRPLDGRIHGSDLTGWRDR